MGSRKGTARRISVTATALTAGLAGAALAAVATGMVSIGTWVPGSDDDTRAELAGSRSRAGDGYGDRGDLFVVTQDNRLHRFDKLGSGRQELSVAITGLAAGERLVGIDTRPANGQLYAVGSTSRLYVIDPATGAAAQVGAPFTTALAGKRFGVDFNPTVDRLRIVSDTGQNLRIDPTTGAVAGVDTALNRSGVTSAAYTNSVAGATSTALYDIDSSKDVLVLQGTKPGVMPAVSPNTGQLFPVGRLSVDVLGLDGFDIVGAAKGDMFDEGDYTALAAVRVKGDGDNTRLVRVDLRTGKASPRGKLPKGVVGITASAGEATTVYATTARNDLVRFDRDSLKIRSQQAITGLGAGEKLLGLDVRPANGQLYALGSTNQIYTVNPRTAAATAVGTPFSADVYGSAVGFDVNPVVDRLRVVTSSGLNLRLVPDTGAVAAVDKSLAYAADDRNAGTGPKVSLAAYTNGFAGATATTLFDIDTGIDVLTVQAPPNDGVLRTSGKLTLDVDSVGGFDIAPDGQAIAALSRSGGSRIYAIDLQSGKARLIGKLGRGSTLTGLAVAPRGVLA
ncbi:DUF4394 domain-containing protein [Phytohabitans houttuyneae]|uniref:DUF4394 domain-containing protein n=1 Tax=Phytohabitans houttuyneae TaxID=1076126 RepID=A0A6V8KC19_9ACTN|nr:DUF4394 domain-containing protein [Phytohabitans houttuyneae]GFJ79948.1 hypothetical protein Phou_041280 [Phytohabitans houttuyneae]